MDYACDVVQANAICAECREIVPAIAPAYAFELWFSNGMPIQQAMPEASVETREAFIGWKNNFYLCSACWPEEG